jgi:glutathione S-transferase
MLTLYDDSWSPNCVKVRLVLREIESVMPLKWRAIPIDLDRGEQHERRFLRTNPLGRVPVLVEGGMVLRESGAILTYLADRFPAARLLPQNTRDRAEAMQWLFFQGTELGRVVTELYDEVCFTEEPSQHKDLIKIYREELSHLLAVLNDHLQKGRPRYLLGTHACIADFALIASLDLLPDVHVSLDPFRMVQAYIERMHARPSWPGVWPAT